MFFSRPLGEKSYKIKTNLTYKMLKHKVIDFVKIWRISARSALSQLWHTLHEHCSFIPTPALSGSGL